MSTLRDDREMDSLKTIAQAVYVLFALSYFAGITAIVGVIVNYVKRDDVVGTWLEGHFVWQRRTFWYGLLWAVIGLATTFILVGFVILFANFCWIIYRVVKGWLNLNDSRPMTF